jgi:hypothetical protein
LSAAHHFGLPEKKPVFHMHRDAGRIGCTIGEIRRAIRDCAARRVDRRGCIVQRRCVAREGIRVRVRVPSGNDRTIACFDRLVCIEGDRRGNASVGGHGGVVSAGHNKKSSGHCDERGFQCSPSSEGAIFVHRRCFRRARDIRSARLEGGSGGLRQDPLEKMTSASEWYGGRRCSL